ncbi:MAG: type II toxin-antitoxin system Phd/YefM family antitoxin [Mycobacteriales bacterium]
MTATITQAELRNGSAGIMDRLQAGADFIITRNGVPVGELRPIAPQRAPTAAELIAVFGDLPRGSSYAEQRAESDAIFGEERIHDA